MNTKKGYFIIADITGFTSFLAGSELEHSQHIMNEILKHIVNKLTPLFTLAEVEGDAVFVYAPFEKFTRTEIILEMIESSYFAFRDRKSTFKRLITCDCKACEMVRSLDLKYIVHFGDYVLTDVTGKPKPFGSSVNIIHRLLKNKITENTGWKSYILFSEECLKNMNLTLHDVHKQIETYEHIGDVPTAALNLDAQYEKFTQNRISYVSPEDSDYFVERVYNVSQPVLWEWVNNPKKRSIWLEVSDWSPVTRPFGRTGKGAINHCANSNFFESLLDYRPFDYYTSELKGKKVSFFLTGKFDLVSNGTKFTWFLKMNNNLPRWIRRYWGRIILKNGLKIDKALKKLDELLKEEKKIISVY